MNTPSKKGVRELAAFLKKKAKKLQSDWEDVPEWLIHAAVEFYESKKPNEKQQMLDAADKLLCANTSEELQEMIDLIEKAEDDEIIDYIEGVEVWEKVQFSFTAKQFLEHIRPL